MKNTKQDIKSVTNNNFLTREELAKKMGLSVPTTTTKAKTTKNSLKQVIQARLNEVIHETLCTEFKEYYYEIGSTIVQHRNQKTSEVIAKEIQGYQLVLPKNNCAFGEDSKVEEGFQIGKQQLYLQGFNTQQAIYVIKNGQTIFFKDVVTKDNK